MIINKPKFWDKKIGLISIFLFPLSLIFTFLIFVKKKITKKRSFKIPIICVGNIYVGGTGKTPTSIFLAKEIEKFGKKVAILRKYYKEHIDEHELIKKNFQNLILNEDRLEGLSDVEKSNFDIVILDDGFQDYRIKKNLNIICFNNNQLIGNGLVLPSGPLRENLSALKDADIVIINGDEESSFKEKILDINKKLKIFYSRYRPINIDRFRGKKLFAIAAIGNPNNFFQLLVQNNLNVEKKLSFPDHYKFSKNEIQKLVEEAKKTNYEIIMTEKDYLRVKDFKIENLNYLKVMLEINKQDELLATIKELYD